MQVDMKRGIIVLHRDELILGNLITAEDEVVQARLPFTRRIIEGADVIIVYCESYTKYLKVRGDQKFVNDNAHIFHNLIHANSLNRIDVRMFNLGFFEHKPYEHRVHFIGKQLSAKHTPTPLCETKYGKRFTHNREEVTCKRCQYFMGVR